jgi:hypothetical protein
MCLQLFARSVTPLCKETAERDSAVSSNPCISVIPALQSTAADELRRTGALAMCAACRTEYQRTHVHAVICNARHPMQARSARRRVAWAIHPAFQLPFRQKRPHAPQSTGLQSPQHATQGCPSRLHPLRAQRGRPNRARGRRAAARGALDAPRPYTARHCRRPWSAHQGGMRLGTRVGHGIQARRCVGMPEAACQGTRGAQRARGVRRRRGGRAGRDGRGMQAVGEGACGGAGRRGGGRCAGAGRAGQGGAGTAGGVERALDGLRQHTGINARISRRSGLSQQGRGGHRARQGRGLTRTRRHTLVRVTPHHTTSHHTPGTHLQR